MKNKFRNFLLINVAVYRLHVVVTWETKPEEIEKFAKAHGCDVATNFKKEFVENTKDAIGMCMEFSKSGPDVLVWLADRPKKTSSYGTLYHELYHAIDSISDSRNLANETEARAYLYEYLATEANRHLWQKR